MAVNSSALPFHSSDHRTAAARDGAARKNELIQPSRTEDSVKTKAPKIKLKRHAMRLVDSLIIRYPSASARYSDQGLLQIAQVDQAGDLRLGQRLLQEIKPDGIVDGLLQAADRLGRHGRLVVKIPGLEHRRLGN